MNFVIFLTTATFFCFMSLKQVCSETHWEDMRVLVLVVSDKKKDVSSTSGMLTTVQTSTLMAHRMKSVVPQRMKVC